MSGPADPHLIAELKQAIRESRVSLSRLARLIDVNQSQVTRFMAGSNISLGTASKLFDKLELRVLRPEVPPILDVAPPAPKPRVRRKPAG